MHILISEHRRNNLLTITCSYCNPLLSLCLFVLLGSTLNTAFGIYTESKIVCPLRQYRCENGRCIPFTWVCDKADDCGDNSDENPHECKEETCRSDEFSCNNKHCIQQRWVCDRDDDCGDGSDEKNCSSATCHPNIDFSCSQHYCINSMWRCDGVYDCPDKSDERGCKQQPSSERLVHCAGHEYDCGDGITCIHQSWLCDGDDDCPNGIDEKNCLNITCRMDQFQCGNQTCIAGHFHCDGNRDCIDGHDEKNCLSNPTGCNLITHFECAYSSCIPLSHVCDRKPDCIGWEDESVQFCGVNECLKNNGECSQICTDLPLGHRCHCNYGFQLIDNRTCKDIDECLEPGACSHYCKNEYGSFKCSCAQGYLQDPNNVARCKASEGRASLLFARHHDIRKLSLDRKEMTSIINGTKLAAALDFVFRTGMVFWSDVREKKIFKAPIDEGNERQAVIEKDLTVSDGLAIDWIYNHIYWTDAEKNTIELANFEGNMRKSLITDGVQEPRAIALNPLVGWMFWTDWGDDPRIEKAGMDGTHRMVIISSDVKWPNGLTLDSVGERIYWVDAKLNIIATCNYNGAERRTVLYSLDALKHPFSITTFEDYIYWTDWDKETIFKANKFTGQELEAITSLKSLHFPMVVHVYHPFRQPSGVNECQSINGHCSHLCLPAPRINSKSPLLSCACPDGLMLLANDLTCIENEVNRLSDSNDEIRFTSRYSGMVVVIVAIAILTCLFGILLVVIYCYNSYVNHNMTSMNFDNPMYRKTTEEQFQFQRENRMNGISRLNEEAEEPVTSLPSSVNGEEGLRCITKSEKFIIKIG